MRWLQAIETFLFNPALRFDVSGAAIYAAERLVAALPADRGDATHGQWLSRSCARLWLDLVPEDGEAEDGLRTRLLSGSHRWDLLVAPKADCLWASGAGLLLSLDHSSSGCGGGCSDSFATLYRQRLVLGTGQRATLPTAWQGFFDPVTFPGPRALPRSPVGVLEAALLADGVSAATLYPLDVPRALALCRRIAPWVVHLTSCEDDVVRRLKTGEVVYALAPCIAPERWTGQVGSWCEAPIGETFGIAVPKTSAKAAVARDVVRLLASESRTLQSAGGHNQPDFDSVSIDRRWWGSHAKETVNLYQSLFSGPAPAARGGDWAGLFVGDVR
jgi:hypothetical protein